jgi:hypothetical protein
MPHCLHTLCTTETLEDGQVLMSLINYDGSTAHVRVAKSQRGANRIADNWSRARGLCWCNRPPIDNDVCDVCGTYVVTGHKDTCTYAL